ncbi:MAG: multiheme c-type cytochrome [Bacteriovoracia bacterium]
MKIQGWGRVVATVAFSLVFFSACTGKQPATTAGGKLRIFYNNDNNGYLEPCGCRVSPIGGIDRRWNGMKAYPDESRVFVDAGNLLFKSTQATDFLAPQWYEQAAGVIEGYNLLAADAVAVGETDLGLGVKKFEALAKLARFPFLSANIYWKGTRNLFVKDSIVVERMGKKIGIFGLFHPALKLPPELEAGDPIAHAHAVVKKLRAQGVDMVIALAHEGYDRDIELAKAEPGIDLLVGANSQSLLQSPDMVGKTLVVQLSNQGQMLGMVEYEAASLPGKRTDFQVVELDGQYNESPRGLANPMKNLLAVTNLRMGEANRKLDERIWAAHEGSAPAGFDTFLSCRDCHSKQAEFQEGKLHAAAFLTLVARKKEMNLDCVKCHSVGMGQPGGFNSLGEAFRDEVGQPVPFEHIKKAMGSIPAPDADYRANPAKIRPDVARWIASLKQAGVKKSFVGVQCENCHGAKPGHPFANDGSATKVATGLCLQCHTKEQMPAWYDGTGKVKPAAVNTALKSVACPR